MTSVSFLTMGPQPGCPGGPLSRARSLLKGSYRASHTSFVASSHNQVTTASHLLTAVVQRDFVQTKFEMWPRLSLAYLTLALIASQRIEHGMRTARISYDECPDKRDYGCCRCLPVSRRRRRAVGIAFHSSIRAYSTSHPGSESGASIIDGL